MPLTKEQRECGHFQFGGHRADFPKVVQREFPASRKRRKVTLTISIFFGIGRHYYVDLTEEDNPLWDPNQKCWVKPWDDVEAKGQRFSERFASERAAERWARRIIAKHFPRHRIVRSGGRDNRWHYKDGD